MLLMIGIVLTFLYMKFCYDSLTNFYQTDYFTDYLSAMIYFFLIIATIEAMFRSVSSWDEHITIVSHHEYNDTFPAYWYKHENKEIKFEIVLESLSTNSNAWWYSIKSQELEDIREELGLGRERIIPLHFCIGYEREGKA